MIPMVVRMDSTPGKVHNTYVYVQSASAPAHWCMSLPFGSRQGPTCKGWGPADARRQLRPLSL